jgi:hypothetical protein
MGAGAQGLTFPEIRLQVDETGIIASELGDDQLRTQPFLTYVAGRRYEDA